MMEEQGETSGHRLSGKRLELAQAEIDGVVGVMRINLEKVLQRDQTLSELENRAGALKDTAAQFEQQAGKLKKKYWWQNLKMMFIIGDIVVILLITIILWATSGSRGSSAPAPAPNPVTETPAGDNN